jgi:two-component system OmpR family response regulator
MLLLIEDEPGIVDFVTRGLEAEGFPVEASLDGIEGERRALSESFDLIVLDLMLPGRDGLEILGSLRSAKIATPVIVLTARGEVEDRVAGLDAGALTVGDIEIDLITRAVCRDGRQVRLSSTEFDLLAHLMRNRGRVLTREELLSAVWGYEHDPQTNIVDVYVGYLRRKLRTAESPAPIRTVRSVGYRLDDAG